METLNIQQNIFTKYHYRVWVYVSTLNADKFKTDAISDTDDFTNPDLKIARDAAVNRYWQIYETMHQSKGFFLPFAAADNFETGKNALFSIGLFLIETTEDGEFEYNLLGYGDKRDTNEAIELEAHLLGYGQTQLYDELRSHQNHLIK
jgi:hypothetical protein